MKIIFFPTHVLILDGVRRPTLYRLHGQHPTSPNKGTARWNGDVRYGCLFEPAQCHVPFHRPRRFATGPDDVQYDASGHDFQLAEGCRMLLPATR